VKALGETAWIEARAALTPRAEALRTRHESVSFGELAARAHRTAGLLRAHGVQPGDVVAMLLPSDSTFAEWLYAVGCCGATVLPLNLRLTPRELAFQLRDSGAGWLVSDASQAERAQQAGRGLDLRLVPADAHREAAPIGEPCGPTDAPLALLYTSGTTGRPKGVELGPESFLHGAVASAFHMGVLPSDRWLACMPLAHVGGLAILLRCCLYGIPVVLHERFDPAALSRAVDREGVTLVSLVPTMLARWLDERDGRPVPPTLRAVLLGGAAASERLLERAQRLGIPLLPTYGLTEAGSQVATRAPGDGARPLAGRLRPLLGISLRIARDDGSTAPPGEAGEIRVHGPTLMRGYRRLPQATEAALRRGWLHTGDVGVLDAEGLLRVLDRREDLIVSGGENVYPAEVEAVLADHPGVREVAVGGREDSDYGERPVAWIVPAAGSPTTQELRRFCRERLAGYKVPVAFEFVDALPRSAVGKIRRRALKTGCADAGFYPRA
jgi:O-succinylbenzoic acid--CoA ligase